MNPVTKFIMESAEHRRDCPYYYNTAKPCTCGLLEARNAWEGFDDGSGKLLIATKVIPY